MREHGNLIVWPSLLAVGLLAAACSDQTKVSMAPKPNFWVTPPPAQCPAGKWTGGGRIDPTGNRLAANYDNVDEPSPTGDPPPAPNPGPYMTGKVTFGFNVFLATNTANRCYVSKGEIEVNGHPLKIAWHVSIHDGVDTFSGDTVFANVFADNSGRGFCLVVGTADAYMTARVNPGDGRETVQFEVCDNDRGGPQNTRSDAMRWRTAGHGDTGLTYLTGGNIVEHGS